MISRSSLYSINRAYGFLIIVSIFVLLYLKGFQFELIYSKDHLMHFYRTWFYRYELLPNFQIWGWDANLDAGYPVGFHYPFFTDVVVALSHLVTFGLFSLEEVYSSYLLLTYLLLVYACYRLGKIAFSPTAGFIASIFFILDYSNHPFGGWSMLFSAGSWPCLLSVAFFFHGIAEFLKGSNNKKISSAWSAGLLFGLAVLTHSIQIVGVLIFLTAVLLTAFLQKKEINLLILFKKTLLILLIVFLISAPYVFTFILYIEYTKYNLREIPDYHNLFKLIFWEGYPLKIGYNFLSVLALLGLLASIVLRRFCLFFLAVLYALVLLIMNKELWNLFLPEFLAEQIRLVEFARFFVYQRILNHLMSAVGAVLIGTFLWKLFVNNKKLVPLGISLLLSSVILLAFLSKDIFSNHRSFFLKDSVPYLEEAKEISGYINNKQEEGKFFRVYVEFQQYRLNAIIFRQLLQVPFAFTDNYVGLHSRFNIEERDPNLMKDLNFRYLITDRLINVSHELKYLKTFNQLHLYEFSFWNPSLITVNGQNEVAKLQEFSSRNITFDVTNLTTETNSVALGINYFPNWQVTLTNGDSEQRELQLKGQNDLAVVEGGSGTYNLKFVTANFQKFSLVLFFLGILLCFYLRSYDLK